MAGALSRLHHRHGNEHEQERDRNGSGHHPWRHPAGGEAEQENPPPEREFAEIVRVPRPVPDPGNQGLARPAPDEKGPQLPVRQPFDGQGSPGNREGDEIEQGKRTDRNRHGMHRNACQEYEQGRAQVNAGEIDEDIDWQSLLELNVGTIYARVGIIEDQIVVLAGQMLDTADVSEVIAILSEVGTLGDMLESLFYGEDRF